MVARGGTGSQLDRQVVSAEPSGDAIFVPAQLQLCDLHAAHRVEDWGLAWQGRPRPPLDDDGERGLGDGLLDTGSPPP